MQFAPRSLEKNQVMTVQAGASVAFALMEQILHNVNNTQISVMRSFCKQVHDPLSFPASIIWSELHITGFSFAHFVVWTEKDTHIEKIVRDDEFFNTHLPRANNVYKVAILPELLAKWYTTKRKKL